MNARTLATSIIMSSFLWLSLPILAGILAALIHWGFVTGYAMANSFLP